MVTESDPFANNVSVIVLNYNQATTTVECLTALARARTDLIREIVVVDNGSDPGELAILREHRARTDFVLVEVGENRFFGEGNNIGVDDARGDYVVFLNNDAFVQPGWIEALSSTMRSDPDVAAVGPMFLYPDGRVQEVGGLALPTGDIVQVGKGAVWGPDHYDTPCAVDFCSAACLMMRRSDFLKVGGFGFEWEPAYYEDADLCLKLRTRCGKVMVNPAARVIHIESKTTSNAQLQLHNISEINRARFVAKWGPWLEARQNHLPSMFVPRTELVELSEDEVDPQIGRGGSPDPQVVLYSPYQLVPGGGERVLFELASHFSTLFGTSQVAISTPHRYSTTRLRQIAATFGFDRVVGTPRPWREVDPEQCRFSVIFGNTILPPLPRLWRVQRLPAAISLLGARSGDRRAGVVAGRLRRNLGVFGLRAAQRQRTRAALRLGRASHPGDHTARRMAGRHGRSALERAPDDRLRGPVLRRWSQQTSGHRH